MKYLLFVVLIGLGSCNNNKEKAADKNKATNAATDPHASMSEGKKLFVMNCASCHMPAKDFTGPALKGAKSRWADKDLLYEFVKDPQAVILKNDYAKGLQQKYGSLMSPSPDLSNEDIDAILNYCDAYTQ